MTVRGADVVVDGLAFPEAPRWHDGLLWVSDQHDRRVVTIDGTGTVVPVLSVPGQPSGLGWLPDGRLLVVSMRDRCVLRREGADTVVHADLSADRKSVV